MKSLRYLFLFFLTVTSCNAGFHCPPASEIYPCECQAHPKRFVRCDGISNMQSVHGTLKDHFMQPLPKLQVANMHSFSLPEHALGEITTRKLIISNSNIRSIDDNAFEGQDSLGLLVLAEDRLENIPGEALKHLTGLITLSLPGNFLMKITEESLSNLTSLKFLGLVDNRISEIEKNAFPKSLISLLLSKNHLSSLNGSLNYLENLEELYASDNRLVNIKDEFKGLYSLRHLILDRNYISDISDSFKDLTSLTDLSLSSNRIQEVGKGLSGLTNLKRLNLSHNYITDLSWKVFEKMEMLENLDLSGNYLKDVCLTLKPLSFLRDLKLSEAHLKKLDTDCFRHMKSLKRLDLSYNQLTNTEAAFLHPLPALAYLRLDHNRLTTIRHELRATKNLRELDISFNNFSFLKIHHLDNNRELLKLKVGGNPWRCTELLTSVLEGLEHRGVDVEGSPRC